MKRLAQNPIFTLILPVWLLCLLACSSSNFNSSTSGTSSAPPISISAPALIKAYQDNEVAADEQYKGKVLSVSGIIDTIGKDIMDSMYVTLKSDEQYSFTSVQCYFADDQKSALSRLTKGQRITVVGTCDGKFGNVALKDCKLQ